MGVYDDPVMMMHNNSPLSISVSMEGKWFSYLHDLNKIIEIYGH